MGIAWHGIYGYGMAVAPPCPHTNLPDFENQMLVGMH